MDFKKESLELHKKNNGKLEISSKVEIKDNTDLSLAYTPGVAEPCKVIHEREELVYDYTSKSNLVAVVTDGSAVLGLGDIGPKAAMPVMEGKSILFKEFADVDAFPICLDTKDVNEIVHIVKSISPTFGGINLEDISSPRCVEIERKLQKELDIPVFHDDQHGTAIVVIAALINALKIVNKDIKKIRVVINGAGAAGGAIAKMLDQLEVEDLIICDSRGIISDKREDLNWFKKELLTISNRNNIDGELEDAIKNSDVFIGVSTGGTLSKELVRTMKKDSIVFALANPTPEIYPDEAKKGGAKVIGTGRSDFPNQINNVLAFPGLFRGALDVGAKEINNEMNIAAAKAIADIINEEDLREDNIIPSIFNKQVSKEVAKAVSKAAIDTGVSRK